MQAVRSSTKTQVSAAQVPGAARPACCNVTCGPSDAKFLLQSTQVVQNILSTSVGSILYLRGLFDESAFSDKSFASVPIHVLNGAESVGDVPVCHSPGAS